MHVFNPEGYGGWPSTLAWNPVAGCESEQVAFRRAEALTHAVSVQGTDDGSFWQAKASQMFVALFHAAALAAGSADGGPVGVRRRHPRRRPSRHGAHDSDGRLAAELTAPAEKTAVDGPDGA